MTATGPITERERKLHAIDFRGGPLLLRVPTMGEEVQAQVQAARMLANDAGPDAEVDPDVLTVDLPTLCLLSMCCRNPKDPNGPPAFGTANMMARQVSADECVELLHKLNAARAKEAGAADDVDVDGAIGALVSCEGVDDALDLFAGWSHERLVALAWSLAGITKTLAEIESDVDDAV